MSSVTVSGIAKGVSRVPKGVSTETMSSITDNGWGDGYFSYWGWVNWVTDLLDNGVESIDVIGGVINDANGTVGFVHGVLSLDYISVAVFALALNVSSYSISYSIVV